MLPYKHIALCILCLVFFPFLSCSENVQFSKEKIEVRTQKGELIGIEIELAKTSAQQQRGFMYRKIIPDGTGMLFIYTQDTTMHFWMKNTPHPLSIAFIDSKGMIRQIADMSAYSLETVSSELSVRYALEVPQGWFSRLGIAVGDSITEESLQKIK